MAVSPSVRRTLRPAAAAWRRLPATVRKPVVTAVGAALIIAGTLAIVLPGPWTIPPILAGLAVLGTEYHWARRLQAHLLRRTREAAARVRVTRVRPAVSPGTDRTCRQAAP